MEQKYKEVMDIVYIEEKENEELLINNIKRTLKIIEKLNDVEVDLSLEPLNYVNETFENAMRSDKKNYHNNKNLQVDENNYFVVGK